MLKKVKYFLAISVLGLGLVNAALGKVYANSVYPVTVASVDQNGNPNDGSGAYDAQLSADGTKVAFLSDASNLDPTVSVPPRTPGTGGPGYVYLKNLQDGTVKLISIGTNGEVDTAGWGALKYRLTPDAKHVLFLTNHNLANPSQASLGFVYVRDLVQDTTTQANFDPSGNFSESQYVTISDDGRYVGFASYPNSHRLFIRDMQTSTTVELPIQGGSPILSGNGQYLFYSNSNASNAEYRYGLNDSSNIPIAYREDGTQYAATNEVVSPSTDGTKVVFSTVWALVTGLDRTCSQGYQAIRPYLNDITANTITPLDVNGDGSDPARCGQTFDSPMITGDGAKAVFLSNAGLAGYEGTNLQVFVRDFAQHTVTGVSLDTDGFYLQRGATTQGYNPGAAISADGSKVAYTSTSPDLPGANGFLQTYATPTAVLPTVGTATWSANPLTPGHDTTVSVPASEISGVGVSAGEYFVDTDPGVGHGALMQYDGTNLTATFGSTLASGTHSVGIRAVDAKGTWSTTAFFELVVNPPDSAPAITSANSASTGMRTSFDYHIQTSGFPRPALSLAGTLPTGLSFTDNGDGTGNIQGIAAVGTNGTYPLTITATNDLGTASQNFTLTVNTTTSAPGFVSASSDTEAYGQPFSFTVVTTGYPAPAITKKGTLPNGVTFVDNGDGTATISGTPAGSSDGQHAYTFTARNGVSPAATQSFSLTITRAPLIKAISSTPATVGTPYTLTISTRGYTTPSLSESGTIPAGLNFADNGDGTATISGTPEPGSGNLYPITITATNENGSTTKTFNLKVYEAPSMAATATTYFTTGQRTTYQVNASGYPRPTFSITGALPASITFNTTTGKFTGKTTTAETGDYYITITATNSQGTATQSLHVRVGPPQ